MIAKLTGKIDELKPAEVIIDVGGVGYQVSIPFTTFEKVQLEKEITLNILTYVREDQLKLFGFYSNDEKKLFEILIKVSGIGPNMALSILSGIGIVDFVNAIEENNSARLLKIPGIGKSKAEKILFELKRKLKQLSELISGEIVKQPSIKNDALEALVSLGFDESKSMKITDKILSEDSKIGLEELVKSALQELSM